MFRDKHVVITGGSSGLGLALAHLLAARGARITLMARNRARLDNAVHELRDRNPDIDLMAVSVDVNDEAAAATAIDRIATDRSGIDMLINSAGILRTGYFEELSMQDFRDVMETNYFGLLNTTRAALPHLKISRGRLINIASIAGLTGTFGYTPYSGSKYALVGLTESLRYELKPRGVTVQLVCPGEFDTPMVQGAQDSRSPENIAHVQTIPPLTVEVVAADTLKGIESGRFMIVPGRIARIMTTFIRHFAGASRWLGDRIIAKSRVKEDT